MLAVSPVILLVQGPPTAQPSVVFVERTVVGLVAVPHTIPLTVTVAPPLDDMVPPPVAEVVAMFVIGVVVVTVGIVLTFTVIKLETAVAVVVVVFLH